MVYRVEGDTSGKAELAYTPQTLCELMSGTATVNNRQVTPPSTLSFPSLGSDVTLLHSQNQKHFLTAGSPKQAVRVTGLLSCAAVIYYDGQGNAWVHHSGSGSITRTNFDETLTNLSTGAGNVWITYAHPNPTDADYKRDLDSLVLWGVPTNRITEVTNMTEFGINKSGLLGC
jgi:hypothetical protein